MTKNPPKSPSPANKPNASANSSNSSNSYAIISLWNRMEDEARRLLRTLPLHPISQLKERKSTRRKVYRSKTRNPHRGMNSKRRSGKLVVTGRQQMAARADCGRTLARSHGHFDALLVGTEVGVLLDKTP